MKIGIEAQRIFRPDKHGMDFVILEVLRRLQSQEDGNHYVVFVAPGPDRCIGSTPRMQIVKLRCPTYPLWEQWALPQAARKAGVELLHCTSNTAPLYCTVPLMLTLHDIIFLTTPKDNSMSRYQQLGWYYRRWNVPRILDHCLHLITVSGREFDNIVLHFPQLKKKLTVVHNGYSECYHPLPPQEVRTITSKYLPDEHYLFFLGNTDPRKNTVGVLHAYNKYLESSKRSLKLVLTGLKRQYVETMLATMGLMRIAPHIVYTGYVPSEDLPALYNGAFAFLCPSLMEGFGIPVLEAMACGTPVITSNCSSLPEVAGTGGILIDPLEPKEISDALLRLETDAELYHQQKEYGLERVKQFSWQHTADSYLEIYRQVASKL